MQETRAWLDQSPDDRGEFENIYARYPELWARVIGNFRPIAPLPIAELPAGESWVVVLDETGSQFDDVRDESRRGRLVVVVFQAHDCPQHAVAHAVETSESGSRALLNRLLNQQVGVLGLTASQGMTRAQLAMQALRWTLRWLVGLGARDVVIQADPYGEDGAVAESTLTAEALLPPGSKAEMRPSVRYQVLPKTQPSLVPYADALAWWWQKTRTTGEIPIAGWTETQQRRCLLTADASTALLHPLVQQAWDAGDTLPVGDWHAALELWPPLRPRLTQRLRALPDMQQRWLDALWHGQQVAAQSARDWQNELAVLAAALSANSFRAVEELKLRTILVQQDAHRGHFGSASEARLMTLSARLRAQEPGLCSQADLVVATLRTNRFAWRESLDQIRHWGHTDSRPGLVQRGRLNSLAGSLAAGNQQFTTAANYLKCAVGLFGRYSDSQVVVEDISRTRYHALFAWLDALALGHRDREPALRQLSALFQPLIGSWTETRIQELATETNPALRFEHRAFLKWALQTNQTTALQIYLSCREGWSGQDVWPGTWILWYRGWLLWPVDPGGAVEQWRLAHALLPAERAGGAFVLMDAWMVEHLRAFDRSGFIRPASIPAGLPERALRRWPTAAHTPGRAPYAAWARALAWALPMDFR